MIYGNDETIATVCSFPSGSIGDIQMLVGFPCKRPEYVLLFPLDCLYFLQISLGLPRSTGGCFGFALVPMRFP